MWKLTKQYWKDMWNYIWSKTSVDEKATNQLYKEGKITESNDRADKLITKRMKKNAKKFAKSIK